jgi:Cupredoxin-like domain
MATCRLLLCAVACNRGSTATPAGSQRIHVPRRGPLEKGGPGASLLTIFTLFAIAATLAAGCAGDDGGTAAEVGQSVRWTNQDGAAHTVTADDGAFDSGSLAGGKSFSFAFDRVGTYAYHCNIHPGMKGTVTVAA